MVKIDKVEQSGQVQGAEANIRCHFNFLRRKNCVILITNSLVRHKMSPVIKGLHVAQCTAENDVTLIRDLKSYSFTAA